MRDAIDFWGQVECLRERDPRYAREAYGFVMLALERTLSRLPAVRRHDPVRRHVSGQELLAGLLDLARDEFGFLACRVLATWGLRGGHDLGVIVFQLVEAGILSRRPEDRLEDFHGGPEFRAVLEEEFPWSSLARPPHHAALARRAPGAVPPGPEV
jgi:uncharacterized repeat protein (TIGR04138 family)